MYEIVAVLTLIAFVYSMVGAGLERTPIGGAITFTAIGFALGPHGFDAIALTVDGEGLGTLAQLTLALVLFADAANTDLRELARSSVLPRRMLIRGLPLTILLGFVLALPLFWGSLGLLEIAILATILAPTDAALGKAVVTDPNVPNRLRTTLNVESGLNDGICVPVFLTFLAFATEVGMEHSFVEVGIELLLEEVGIGLIVGVGLAAIGAGLVAICENRGWVDDIWRQLSVPMLAVGSYAAAQALGGSGFIAAFTGGLAFGGLIRTHKHAALQAAEGIGNAMALLTWVVFGAVIVGDYMMQATWQMIVYAVLSLTLIRMLPIWLSLKGTRLRADEKLFLGWFGPRGLASIVFGVMLLRTDLPGGPLIATTVVCAILMSIIAHGSSAGPLSKLLAGRLRAAGESEEPADEGEPRNGGDA